MEKRPPATIKQPVQSPSSGPALVKRIKVPVKRPGVPVPPAPPAAPRPQQQPTMIKVPVKRIKVPVAKIPVQPPRPVQPSASPAAIQPVPRPAVQPQPARTPAPPPQTYAPATPVKKPLQARRSSETRYKRIVYEIPEDLLDRIEERETVPEKFFLLYLYARSLAENNAEQDGYTFPQMLLDIPKDVREAADAMDEIDEEIYEAVLDDMAELATFIPELDRVMSSKAPLEQIMQAEIQRIQKLGHPSSGQKIAMGYLMVMADMRAIEYKLEMREMEDDEEETVDEIRSIENEEKELKQAFIKAIKMKNFPVDADRLIKNYFSLAKKDAEKAYQTLTTNPLFFSPIQMEKIPNHFFGLIKAGPKEAIAVNKKLASFLKNLKV